jgi:hypothetical protein
MAREGERRKRGVLALRLVALGAALIFGGEAFCILGPLRYESIVHTTCHIALFTGIALVFLGGVIHFRSRAR